MAREVRITIDDDELFERMKERKRALDLSWEEVLHRGLRPPEADEGRSRDRADFEAAKTDLKRAIIELAADRAIPEDHLGTRRDNTEGPVLDPFEPDSIGNFVADTVQRSTAFLGEAEWDEDLDRVTDAEDAALVFPFLGHEGEIPSNQIPLRVRLDVSGTGLDIEVVTIRRGKDTAQMNAFDPQIRQAVIEGIAGGQLADLQLESGSESYSVVPVIGWSRGGDGRPHADEVIIEEVVFGAD